MVESRVNHAVRRCRAAAEAVEIFERTAVDLGAHPRKGLGPCIGARNADHLMARPDELLNDSRADEARGAGDENAHGFLLC